jgi:hypothetical protein
MVANMNPKLSRIGVGRYDQPEKVGWLGWIEDEEKTWVAYISLDGVPHFYLNRNESGKVLAA